jgi:hypothetical protein
MVLVSQSASQTIQHSSRAAGPEILRSLLYTGAEKEKSARQVARNSNEKQRNAHWT